MLRIPAQPNAQPSADANSPVQRALAGFLAGVTLTGLTGCGMLSWLDDEEKAPPGITPDAFVHVAPNTEDPTTGTSATQSTAETSSTDTSTEPTIPTNNPTINTSTAALPINAMVGYINNEAVYADHIFDVNLIAQLQSFGKRYDGEQFRTAATQAIQEKLRGIIINKLILGEAELNLNDQQRQYISTLVNREREELIRFYGQGSISKARAEFRKDKGLELDDHLNALREEYAVQAFLQAKVMPKISVTQLMVRNYYEENIEKFNQPDMRTFRIIYVSGADTAQSIKQRLDAGESFKDLASDPATNLYNTDNAGIFNSGKPMPGDKVYGIQAVNEALMQLKEGEYAGPFPAGKNHYFTQLLTYTPGKEIALEDAQLDIELILRNLEYERLTLRLRMNMLKRGSYTPPEKMGVKLLEIAAARYDQ